MHIKCIGEPNVQSRGPTKCTTIRAQATSRQDGNTWPVTSSPRRARSSLLPLLVPRKVEPRTLQQDRGPKGEGAFF